MPSISRCSRIAKTPELDVADPGGLVRSQVIETADGALRVVLNGSQSQRTQSSRFLTGSSARACSTSPSRPTTSSARCRRCARPAAPLPIPENYYDDLEARSGLPAERLDVLRENGILWDRDGEGEFCRPTRAASSSCSSSSWSSGAAAIAASARPNAPIRLAAQARLTPAAERAGLRRERGGGDGNATDRAARLVEPAAYVDPGYKSTALRGPTPSWCRSRRRSPSSTGPGLRPRHRRPLDDDLTKNGGSNGEPLGERIIVAGRVLDEDGRPGARHRWSRSGRPTPPAATSTRVDQHDAPLDPNFLGAGRVCHRRRGPLPLHHHQAGRLPLAQPPQCLAARRTSTSRCSGRAFSTRLVTQMYFPGDPLLALDPIFNAVPDEARASGWSRLLDRRDPARMGARLPLRHRAARPARDARGRR